jgi:putative intracellular protease/amidase
MVAREASGRRRRRAPPGSSNLGGVRFVIPLFDRFTALDAVGPYEVISRLPGAEVTFAAGHAGPVRTDTGFLALQPTAALDDVDGCDVLVVPGGPGTRQMMHDEVLLSWVRRVHGTTTWTTSVCTGSLVLGGAGLLDGLSATTHWSVPDVLESFGASYSPARVVIEGKIITAAGVSAGIDMALVLASRIAGEETAKAIQLGIEYDPQPPFDSGSLAKASPSTIELARRRARPDP